MKRKLVLYFERYLPFFLFVDSECPQTVEQKSLRGEDSQNSIDSYVAFLRNVGYLLYQQRCSSTLR